MKQYERALEINFDDLPIEDGQRFESLSEEELIKAQLVGSIINNFIKSHEVEEHQYGELFDKFFDKSVTELIMLEGMYKM